MRLSVRTEIKLEDLEKVMDIDRAVYEPEYVGELENMRVRFRANERSFVCMFDEDADRLAGYINFFPCTDALYRDIVWESDVIRDDDIRADEIAPYGSEENHLFILSIAVHPDYQGKKAVQEALSNGWIQCLNELQKDGYPITDISATAVSPGGKKWLCNHMFVQVRRLSDGNVVYLSRGEMLEKLLANELYIKSYHNDIYLMLPLADNRRNRLLDGLFPDAREDGEDAESEEEDPADGADGDGGGRMSAYDPEYYIECLEESLCYECTNDVISELRIANLGKLTFLHTTDDYPQGKKDADKKVVVGETEAFAVLAAHRATHMYVLTLILPDCAYSTTRLEDQLSYGYLRILAPEDPQKDLEKEPDAPVREWDLYQYLRQKYGLHKCGQGKCLLCMSNMPDDELEFRHILLGEAYNSLKVTYHADSRELDEICENSHAQYDYYDVYLSEMVIAFILKDKERTTKEQQIKWFREEIDDRIETMASYSFIVEVVMFQNIALAKATTKISNALSNGGDISHEQVEELYRDFGRTIRFWEIHNFKYPGAQAEAAHIARAFENESLKENYYKHQEFLEHMVELKASKAEARNGMLISVIGTILAVLQVKDVLEAVFHATTDFLNRFYVETMGVEEVHVESSLMAGIVILCTMTIAVGVILKQKRKNMRKINMRSALKEKELEEKDE